MGASAAPRVHVSMHQSCAPLPGTQLCMVAGTGTDHFPHGHTASSCLEVQGQQRLRRQCYQPPQQLTHRLGRNTPSIAHGVTSQPLLSFTDQGPSYLSVAGTHCISCGLGYERGTHSLANYLAQSGIMLWKE